MRVSILECPTTGSDVRPLLRPVTLDVEHLPWKEPFEPLHRTSAFGFATSLKQAMGCKTGIPNGRHARLAQDLIFGLNKQFFDRISSYGAIGIAFGYAKRIKHHDAVRHRRKNCTKPILAVQPLFYKSNGFIDGAPAHPCW